MIRSFFGYLSRSICLIITERLVPTWQAVNTPPEALHRTQESIGEKMGTTLEFIEKKIAVYSPLPNLDEVAIQPCGICIRANMLQAFDYIGVICLALLFPSPWCPTSSLR